MGGTFRTRPYPLCPDIHPEPPGRSISWISGTQTAQNPPNPVRISTRSALEAQFHGYPAPKPPEPRLLPARYPSRTLWKPVFVDIRHPNRQKPASPQPDIHVELPARPFSWISGTPDRQNPAASLPDIHPEPPRRPIPWISGTQTAQNPQNPVRISTRSALESQFHGYPAPDPPESGSHEMSGPPACIAQNLSAGIMRYYAKNSIFATSDKTIEYEGVVS